MMEGPWTVHCDIANTTRTAIYYGYAPPSTTLMCIDGVPFIPAPTYDFFKSEGLRLGLPVFLIIVTVLLHCLAI